MAQPSGQEFALEYINQRETSIVVRKTGRDTLVQRNGNGAPVVIEITDAVKAMLIQLWSPPSSFEVIACGGGGAQNLLNAGQQMMGNLANLNALGSQGGGNFTPDKSTYEEPPKRRGRPPKSEAV